MEYKHTTVIYPVKACLETTINGYFLAFFTEASIQLVNSTPTSVSVQPSPTSIAVLPHQRPIRTHRKQHITQPVQLDIPVFIHRILGFQM